MSGEVKGREGGGKTAIITSCQWGENMPWSCSTIFFPRSSLTVFFYQVFFFFLLLLHDPPLRLSSLLSPSLAENAPNKAAATSHQTPAICWGSGSLWGTYKQKSVWHTLTSSPLPVCTCPWSAYSQKGPFGFPSSADPSPQPHQHTPVRREERRAGGLATCAGWDHTHAHRDHARIHTHTHKTHKKKINFCTHGIQMCSGRVNREIRKES